MAYKRKRVAYKKSKGKKYANKRSKVSTSYKKKKVFPKASMGNSIAKKIGTSHWLSYAKTGYPGLKKFNTKFNKGWIKTNGDVKNMVTVTGVVANTVSLQAVAVVGSYYTPYDVKAYSTQSVYQRALFKSCSSVTTFMNQTNSPVFLDLYDMSSRKDIAETQTAFNNPYFAMATDISSIFTYGVTPYMSATCCERYKINNVTRINLAPGETCDHVTSIKPMGVFKDGEAIPATPTIDLGSFNQLTHWTLAIARGCPADPLTNTVGAASVKIDYITRKLYTYTWLTLTSNTTTATNVLPATAVRVMELDGDSNLQVIS